MPDQRTIEATWNTDFSTDPMKGIPPRAVMGQVVRFNFTWNGAGAAPSPGQVEIWISRKTFNGPGIYHFLSNRVTINPDNSFYIDLTETESAIHPDVYCVEARDVTNNSQNVLSQKRFELTPSPVFTPVIAPTPLLVPLNLGGTGADLSGSVAGVLLKAPDATALSVLPTDPAGTRLLLETGAWAPVLGMNLGTPNRVLFTDAAGNLALSPGLSFANPPGTERLNVGNYGATNGAIGVLGSGGGLYVGGDGTAATAPFQADALTGAVKTPSVSNPAGALDLQSYNVTPIYMGTSAYGRKAAFDPGDGWFMVDSGMQFCWGPVGAGNPDTGFQRPSAGVVRVTDGGANRGTLQAHGIDLSTNPSEYWFIPFSANATAYNTNFNITVGTAARLDFSNNADVAGSMLQLTGYNAAVQAHNFNVGYQSAVRYALSTVNPDSVGMAITGAALQTAPLLALHPTLSQTANSLEFYRPIVGEDASNYSRLTAGWKPNRVAFALDIENAGTGYTSELWLTAPNSLVFGTNAGAWLVNTNGNIIPNSNKSQDLGSTASNVGTVYGQKAIFDGSGLINDPALSLNCGVGNAGFKLTGTGGSGAVDFCVINDPGWGPTAGGNGSSAFGMQTVNRSLRFHAINNAFDSGPYAFEFDQKEGFSYPRGTMALRNNPSQTLPAFASYVGDTPTFQVDINGNVQAASGKFKNTGSASITMDIINSPGQYWMRFTAADGVYTYGSMYAGAYGLTWGSDFNHVFIPGGSTGKGALMLGFNEGTNVPTYMLGIMPMVGQAAMSLWPEVSNPTVDPPAHAGSVQQYIRVNGGGKMEVCYRFPTGAPQVVATEP